MDARTAATALSANRVGFGLAMALAPRAIAAPAWLGALEEEG